MRMPVILILLTLLAGCSSSPRADGDEFEHTAAEYMARGDYAPAMLAASAELENASSPEAAAELLLIISKCHAAASNNPASFEFARMASERAPQSIAAQRAMVDAATRSGNYDYALELLEAIIPTDSAEILASLRQKVEPALGAGRPEVAKDALEQLVRRSEWMTPRQLIVLAQLRQAAGEADSAKAIFVGLNVDDMNEPMSLASLADYYAAVGELPKSIAAFKRLAAIQDSIIHAAETADIYSKLYDHEHAVRLRQMARDEVRIARLHYIIPVIAAALAAVIALALYIRVAGKRKLLKAQNDLLLVAEDMRKQREQSRTIIGRLFKDSYDSIELAANLLIDGNASKSTEVVMRQLRQTVDRCRQPDFLRKLEAAVNGCQDNVMSRIRADITAATESEISVALYCAAGLSARVICLILDCTPASLYNKKYRLKRKIQTAEIAEQSRLEYLQLID